MNSKLTLSIEKDIIDAAKAYAKSQGRSLSNVIEEYLKSVTKKETRKKDFEFNSLIEELSGCVELPPNKTYEDIKTEALIEKYLK